MDYIFQSSGRGSGKNINSKNSTIPKIAEGKGPRFQFIPNDTNDHSYFGLVVCKRPNHFILLVSREPLQKGEYKESIKDNRGFYLTYHQESAPLLSSSLLKRMADWYYYTIIKKTDEPGPDKSKI